MNAVEDEKVTSDQSLFLLKEFKVQAYILLCLPEPKASKKTVLKVKILRSAFAKGSNRGRLRASKARDKSQLGIALFAKGLSL